MRPSVVLFGEALDPRVLEAARDAAAGATLFVVLGSSLLVSPANALPRIAKQAGARLAIVNRDPTPLDDAADLVERASIGETLERVAGLL
jgi:NAD-dependent deacetylase